MTFGMAITQARRHKKMTQKQVAAATSKEAGTAISPQYLNDIEHDRRGPPAEHMARQLAETLDLDPDYLSFLSGRVPSDMSKLPRTPEDVTLAMRELRKDLQSRGSG